jgi:hypothetical protein
MPKRVSRNTCRFHRIAVFANGSSVHHFEHVIKQETHIFTKVIILIIKTFRFYQKNSLPNFLENSRNFTKSKTFYQIWSHCLHNT